jgi:hypothetical protein
VRFKPYFKERFMSDMPDKGLPENASGIIETIGNIPETVTKFIEGVPVLWLIYANPKTALFVATVAVVYGMYKLGYLYRTSNTASQLRSDVLSPQQRELVKRSFIPSRDPVISLIGAGNDNKEVLPAVSVLRNPVGGFGEILVLKEMDGKGTPTGRHHYYLSETPDAYEGFFGFSYKDKFRQDMVKRESRRILHIATIEGDVEEQLTVMYNHFYQTRHRNHVAFGNLFREDEPGYAQGKARSSVRNPRFGAVIEPVLEKGEKYFTVKIRLEPKAQSELMPVDIIANEPHVKMTFTNRFDAMDAVHAYYARFHNLIPQYHSGKVTYEDYLKQMQDLPSQLENDGTETSVPGFETKVAERDRREMARVLNQREGVLNPENLINALKLSLDLYKNGFDGSLFKRAIAVVGGGLPNREQGAHWGSLTDKTTEVVKEFGQSSRVVPEKGVVEIRRQIKDGLLQPFDFMDSSFTHGASFVNYVHTQDGKAGLGWLSHAVFNYLENQLAKRVANMVKQGEAFHDGERPCGIRPIKIDNGPNAGDVWVVKNPGVWKKLRQTGAEGIDVAEAQDYPDYMRDVFAEDKNGNGQRILLMRGKRIYVFDRTKEVESWIDGACQRTARNAAGKQFDAVNLNKRVAVLGRSTINAAAARKLTLHHGAFAGIHAWDKDIQDYVVLVIKRSKSTGGMYGLVGGYLETRDEQEYPVKGALREVGGELAVRGEYAISPILKDLALEDFGKPLLTGIDPKGYRGPTRYTGFGLLLNSERYNTAKEFIKLVGADSTGNEVDAAMFVPSRLLNSPEGREKYPFLHAHEREFLDRLPRPVTGVRWALNYLGLRLAA